MKIITKLIFLIILYFFTSAFSEADFNSNLKNYNNLVKIIDNKGTEIAKFKVAIASNDQKRRYGLMNLKELPQEYGMLFIFDQNKFISMWMKNTIIPLDILFIDSNNIIQDIKSDAEPYSLEIIKSKQRVDKVLEINSGLAESLHLQTGYKIIF